MASVITNDQQVKKLQAQFHKLLVKSFTDKYHRRVSFQPGGVDLDVHYHKGSGVWFGAKKSHNRGWNAFGTGNAAVEKTLNITVEINFPDQNPDAWIGGVFVQDGKHVLVCHRGSIGGGRAGIGKQLFMDQFSGDFITADQDGKPVKLALVAQMDSPLFTNQIAAFVKEAEQIKQYKTDPRIQNLKQKAKGFDETHGRSEGNRSSKYFIHRVHGLVHSALKIKLVEQGYIVWNDKNRDLVAQKGKRDITLFEIKTSESLTDVYQAIGQLTIYSIVLPANTKLTMVVPKKPAAAIVRKLNEIGISILVYSWNKTTPVFDC